MTDVRMRHILIGMEAGCNLLEDRPHTEPCRCQTHNDGTRPYPLYGRDPS